MLSSPFMAEHSPECVQCLRMGTRWFLLVAICRIKIVQMKNLKLHALNLFVFYRNTQGTRLSLVEISTVSMILPVTTGAPLCKQSFVQNEYSVSSLMAQHGSAELHRESTIIFLRIHNSVFDWWTVTMVMTSLLSRTLGSNLWTTPQGPPISQTASSTQKAQTL